MSGLRHPAGAMLLAMVLGSSILISPAYAANQSKARQAAPAVQFVDGIAAIVDQEVITLSQLNEKTIQVGRQMKQQGIPVPDDATLKHQVLQQMINATLQNQEAKRIGVKIADAQVEQAIGSVAQRNRLTVEQLRREILSNGLSWDQYREEIRTQMQDDILRQRFVEDRISISDDDIDAFLHSQGDQMPIPQAAAPQVPEPAPQPAAPSGPELVELAQILIEVPDYATDSTVAEKRKEAESILSKLKSGADFAGAAAASSNGPQALEGGEMGIRPLKDWPDLFVRAIADTPAGGISGIIQSGRGFHILKVLRRGYAQRPAPKQAVQPAPAARAPAAQVPAGPMMITQTKARHILIKTSQIVDDDKALATLESLRQRIEHGESFAELAKRYSQDTSAPQGGELGWLNPGDTVPAFEQTMDALQPGEVSQPVKSNFGWHLIQVEERRAKNVEAEFRRMQARRELMRRRIGPAYEDWLDQLRSQAYIDNRLDKQSEGQQ